MRRECRERFPCHHLQRKPRVSDPGMHHGTCVTARALMHVGIANLRWRGKRSRHSWCMRNPQFFNAQRLYRRSCIYKDVSYHDNGLMHNQTSPLLKKNCVIVTWTLETYSNGSKYKFTFKKINLKMSSAKLWPFCLGLDVLLKCCSKVVSYKNTMLCFLVHTYTDWPIQCQVIVWINACLSIVTMR